MGVLNNSWLLLVAIVYGAYIAAIIHEWVQEYQKEVDK